MSFTLQQSEEENADEEFDFRPAGEEETGDQFMSRSLRFFGVIYLNLKNNLLPDPVLVLAHPQGKAVRRKTVLMTRWPKRLFYSPNLVLSQSSRAFSPSLVQASSGEHSFDEPSQVGGYVMPLHQGGGGGTSGKEER